MAENMSMGKQFQANPKRKFRWKIGFEKGSGVEDVEYYVKTFARPGMTFEETVLDFRHEKMWIAGKMTWDSISMTILDVEESSGMYDWIRKVYELAMPQGNAVPVTGDTNFAKMGKDDPRNALTYKKTVDLTLLDSRGESLEAWKLFNAWPQTAKFGDLDYASSDTLDIEVTLRFDRAIRTDAAKTDAAKT